VSVFSGLIFMNQKMQKSKSNHKREIEQLKKTVVELAEKQLVLSEKMLLENQLKNSCNNHFENLNRGIFKLYDLLMKLIETKGQQKP
jgi:regulator of sigma D